MATARAEGHRSRLADTALTVFYPLTPEATNDREAFTAVLTMIRAGLPDLRMTFRHVATQGGTVVVGWDARATHAGTLFGIEPTGREVTWTGLSVVETAGGRVISERGEEDALGLLRQLGAAPASRIIRLQ